MTRAPAGRPAEAHDRGYDPVTGYDLVGHEWNGITELNTPLPKIAVIALLLAFIYSVICWILLPAWPTGTGYTRGLLGRDQGALAIAGYQKITASRAPWMSRFDKPDFATLAADSKLMAEVRPAAARLFADNCAACHGTGGTGGPGFPVLADKYWLWGGDPGTIAETIRVGINSADPNTRVSEMPNFSSLSRDDRATLAAYVAALPSGKAAAGSPGAKLFADNCTSCHGDAGEGGMNNGAPSLTDASVIYGQDVATVEQTLQFGRQGEMPTWAPRLGAAEINLLALYVSQLGDGKTEAPK